MSSTTIFYCPTFQNASWSALVAKLFQQPTLVFASLSPFCLIKRHPMEPEIKAEVPHCRDWRKKSLRMSAAICGENRLRFSPQIQIRRDRRIKSPGVSPA